MGFGPLWRGVGLQHTRGLFGPSVNRWSIKRSPNGTKLDRWSTGSKPRPHDKYRSNPKTFNPHTRKEVERTPDDIGAPDCKTDNGENARMHETNMYANAVHMMTWYEMHDTGNNPQRQKPEPEEK